MLHSFYGQEITEPSTQILKLKLNHYLALFCGLFKKNIIYACSVCVHMYICMCERVCTCAHMYVDNFGYCFSSEKQSSGAMHFAF